LVACEQDSHPIQDETSQEDAASVQEQTSEMEEKPEEQQPADAPPPTDTQAPTSVPPTDTPEPLPTEAPGMPPLPPEPQEITFEAEDGIVLQGRYYPAAVNPAPIVVLMHWAGGDRNDWNEIAFWLQNRGLAGTSPNVGTAPWLEPTWFPPMIAGQSFGVFTFTFRDCDGGCNNFSANRELWRRDAFAALKKARELEGVDPMLVSTFGASIGADGSPDACGPFNHEFEGGCLGALSLSPGGYLRVPYADAVKVLDEFDPPSPAWCFFSTGDGEASTACKSASGDLYQTFEWSGDSHGMVLLQPDIEPSAMELILDFLKLIYNLE
jgi:hypothetical protein